MKKNLESVAQRGEHIDTLQDKSENLNQSAQGFRRGANRVRKQMWWKNMKMRIWIIVGIIVLLLIIIIPSGGSFSLFFRFFVLGFSSSRDILSWTIARAQPATPSAPILEDGSFFLDKS